MSVGVEPGSFPDVSVIFKRRSGSISLYHQGGTKNMSRRTLHQTQPKEARCLTCDGQTKYEYPSGRKRPSWAANGPFRQGSQMEGGLSGSLGLEAILVL